MISNLRPKLPMASIGLAASLTFFLFACGTGYRDIQGAPLKGTTTTTGDFLTLDVLEAPLKYTNLVTQLTGLAQRKVQSGGIFPSISASYAACGEVLEIPQTQVCVFNYQKFMNHAVNRISQWVEANQMIDHIKHTSSFQNSQVEGHDLPAPALEAFRKAYSAQSGSMKFPVGSSGEEVKEVVKLEQEFNEGFIVPHLLKQKNMVLLAVSLDTDLESSLDHEILHSQYFQTPSMREAVESYFAANVTDSEVDAIASAFAGAYDVKPLGSDDAATKAKKRDLLVNEFQAYILEKGAEKSLLKSLVSKHRPLLLAALKAAGISPFGGG